MVVLQLEAGRGAKNPPPQILLICYETETTASAQDAFFGKMTQAPENVYGI
jgi:hypothetical protein